MMQVKLKWITPDAQDMIVDCARVSSNPDAAKRPDADLIAYLVRNKHWSPFEMASACLEISTTRDIARQILRHRSFSFQEFSQRYQDVGILGDPVIRECRMQHPTNRQASLETDDQALSAEWEEAQSRLYATAITAYREALKAGIAKEVARALLPEGLTPSRMFMSGTIRSWAHFIDVRTDMAAQKEVRDIAHQAKWLLARHLPIVFAART